MRNRKTKSFREAYYNKKEISIVNEASFFGIIFGIAVFAFSGYNSLCTVGLVNILFKTMSVCAIVLVIVTVAFPMLISKPVAVLKKLFQRIGKIILIVLLSPVYILICLANLLMNKPYSEKFQFARWDNEAKFVPAGFSDYEEVEYKEHKFITLGILDEVFSFFSKKKMFILIPIATLLFILGIIMFFASSNAVFSFIYTLF